MIITVRAAVGIAGLLLFIFTRWLEDDGGVLTEPPAGAS